MDQIKQAALQLFANRLASRSILTEREMEAVLGLGGQVTRVAAHVDLFRSGQRVDHACLVAEGLVGRFGQNKDGSRQITCLHIRGDMADLPSVVSPRAGWGLGTLASSTIIRIPHAEVRRIAAAHPGVAEALWRDCVAEGSMFSEWVVNVGRRDALGRLAHLLCEMAVRLERAGQGDRHAFPLPITQSDYGDATGLTSVHVNRTLKALKNQSLATVHLGKVTIHDWEQLASVADFDEAYLLLDGPSMRIVEEHPDHGGPRVHQSRSDERDNRPLLRSM
jgi:CRP-like cAMP-binding protein